MAESIERLCCQPLLDAMPGIAYVTSPSGVIVAYGRPNWNEFAAANRGEALLKPEDVCGRKLAEFLTGSQVRRAYEAAANLVITFRQPSVTYTYRCDAPDLRRELRLTISPIVSENRLQGLLYHSIVISETARPHLDLLLRASVASNEPPANMISICSYCKCVSHSGQDGEKIWITPESFYEMGGDESALVSHGICPECWVRIVKPLLDGLRPIA